jgi:CubicO group peptidase (beta-lactamase class C family)
MKTPMRKLLLLATVLYGRHYFRQLMFIISGYAAKHICTAVFGSGRKASHVHSNELAFFPLNLSRYRIDYENKTVTTTVWGMARQKAKFRPGLGACLLDRKGKPMPVLKPLKRKFKPIQESRNHLWPKGDLLPEDFRNKKWHQSLTQTVDQYFDAPGEPKKHRTSAVVVVHRDCLLHEKYAPGFDLHTPLSGWSMTKSLVNAIMGVMVQQGKMDITEPTGLREWQGDRRRDITFNHLLQMTSGLRWHEQYMHLSEVTQMLFLQADVSEFAIQRKAWHKPGRRWVYASGSTNVLCELIRRRFDNDQKYWQYPQKELFGRINAYSFFMETDSRGTFVGSSYASATARDWARFGQLYLNDGLWEGKRVLPEGWVRYSKTPSEASQGQYGAHFWLNASGELLPDAPRDTFVAQGYDGQRIFIVPSRQAVIVRTGFSKEDFDYNGFLKSVLDELPV